MFPGSGFWLLAKDRIFWEICLSSLFISSFIILKSPQSFTGIEKSKKILWFLSHQWPWLWAASPIGYGRGVEAGEPASRRRGGRPWRTVCFLIRRPVFGNRAPPASRAMAAAVHGHGRSRAGGAAADGRRGWIESTTWSLCRPMVTAAEACLTRTPIALTGPSAGSSLTPPSSRVMGTHQRAASPSLCRATAAAALSRVAGLMAGFLVPVLSQSAAFPVSTCSTVHLLCSATIK